MSDEPDEMVAAVEQWLADNPPKPVDQFLTENNEILRAEITRLQAELAEVRDKALDEAAGELERLDGFGEWWEAAQTIRALKSPKPQEATMSEGVGG